MVEWESDDVSVRAEAVTRRTYNRPLDEEGREFESWERTVRRSHYDHHLRLWEEAGGKPNLGELEELNSLGLSRAGLVAGRTLWLGGTDYAFSRPASQFNCAATGLSTVYDMVDAFWGLLNGCGMGGLPQSGTLHGYSKPIPELLIISSERDKDWRGPKENVEIKPNEKNDWTWTIQIGDSAEAWAKALGKMLISPRTRCDKLVIDGSNVRGKGGRLRGYGWICNGFEPLAESLRAVHKILNDSAGNLLDEEQIGDIFNWCGCVLSSRRAAEALMLPSNHPRSREFATRKKDYWSNGKKQRGQSNNSLMFWQRPSVDDIADLLYMNLVGGEPGFVNALAAMLKCPWFSLFNPCVPGQTRILTDKGYVRIDSVVGDEVNVWNGQQWSAVTPKITGRNQPLLKVSLSDGTDLVCTTYHEWCINRGRYGRPEERRVKAKDLTVGDTLMKYDMPVSTHGTPMKHAYAHGFYCGDGHDGGSRGPMVWVYNEKHALIDHLHPRKVYKTRKNRTLVSLPDDIPNKFVVPHDADVKSRLEWLAGIMDSDGSVARNPNGVNVQIVSIDKKFLSEIRLLLTTLGVSAKICDLLPAGRLYGKYECQASYRLLISSMDVWNLKQLGLNCRRLHIPDTKPQRDARRFVKVVAVEPAGMAETVYCFTEPLQHRGTFEGVVTGQCFEILLARYGFCNLASLCLPMFGRSMARLERAVHVMARANYRQTCVNLKDGVLQSQWHQTNEALRLCGLSFTGIVQAPWLTDYDIRRLRNAAINGAYSMAYELGTPLPKAVTTIKPEGTRSKISGRQRLGEISEGMHLPPGEFMVNWIAFSAMDPMVKALEVAGYRVIEKPNDPNAMLVRFPIRYHDCPFQVVNGRKVNMEPALDQLRRYRRWNTLFADHNVSATISFSREEVPEMAKWIHRNWDKGYVATAFSARIDPFMTAEQVGHPYLPQEVVTEADFFKMTSGLKPVDWRAGHTGWHDIDESGCSMGVCPTK